MKKDEYRRIYDDDDSYEFIYDVEEELEEYYFNAVNELRGTIGMGDCIYCGGKNTMHYEGHICFICDQCGGAIHEDLYYRWLAGDNIITED